MSDRRASPPRRSGVRDYERERDRDRDRDWRSGSSRYRDAPPPSSSSSRPYGGGERGGPPPSSSSRHKRSVSPPSRGDDADPGRDRDRRRDRDHDHDRERASSKEEAGQPEDGEVEDTGDAAAGPSEEDMMAMLGFGGFGTTKGKKVAANEAGAAEVKKERTWRQYMNRKGGFNRPLDKI
ncbi:uncharacterized protein PSFLO_01806 [Pseudozyma flocculosa]|uniref:U4/U6.U5 small nuclear ribonucleoprotein 27kDa protein domain-containing protein n=1 Tax=Pseudozyma flocculosa TaxID=84751 RepID=A0A5C3EX30_9BASI|nr:uncharacterized protein PSFLO_01806 [Pseudozyma flocculosa]